MRVFPEYEGKMMNWPRVEALPAAAETLAALRPTWRLAVATNAGESEEADIYAALERVELAGYFDKIYCFRKVGFKKPAPEFFAAIVADLGLAPANLVMVGDDFQADVQGAVAQGLRAVWLNLHSAEQRAGARFCTISDLSELPKRLEDWP